MEETKETIMGFFPTALFLQVNVLSSELVEKILMLCVAAFISVVSQFFVKFMDRKFRKR